MSSRIKKAHVQVDAKSEKDFKSKISKNTRDREPGQITTRVTSTGIGSEKKQISVHESFDV